MRVFRRKDRAKAEVAALTWGSGPKRRRERASRYDGSCRRENSARRGIFLATRKRRDKVEEARAMRRG